MKKVERLLLENLLIIFSLFLPCRIFAEASPTDLIESFQPVTTSGKKARWVTIEYHLNLPLRKEEHLLIQFIEMSGDSLAGMPENYEQLRADFEEVSEANRGYPLFHESGDLDEEHALYWIKRQQSFHDKLQSTDVFKRSIVLDIIIDYNQTKVDQANQMLHLVYKVRRELELKDEQADFSDFILREHLPLSLHEHYYRVLGAENLKADAIEYLLARQLPRPRLAWQKILRSVKHQCLGEDAVPGILTLDRFVDTYKPLDSGCYLPKELFSSAEIIANENAVLEVKPYPEYQELFKDNNLSLLIALQECNDKRYKCSENALNHPTQIKSLHAEITKFGFHKVQETPNTTLYQRHLGEFTIDLTLYVQQRPVYYERDFWELFPKAEIILTNRLPLLEEHLTRGYTPRYQIVLAENAQRLGWQRILPQLDYRVRNFDAIAVAVEYTLQLQLLNFFETIIQSSQHYDEPLANWKVDADWRFLLQTLEAGEKPQRAIAQYVRGNAFTPGRPPELLNFAKVPDLSQYLELLNREQLTPEYSINYRLAYLYLTLYMGDQASDFNVLQGSLQEICRTEIHNKQVKPLFFSANCTPRSILASEKTLIHDFNFARSSYLNLYFGKAGIPKEAYLADTTQMGLFKFKRYFQDNGGVVRFHQKTGKVKQGHLAENTDYQGLPLLGGLGSSMVRFFEEGQLRTAQLREPSSYTTNGRVLKLQGGWTGPHQISFHPSGQLACAYFAEETMIDGFPLAHVEANSRGLDTKRVCFHANGKLKAGVLAKDLLLEEVRYPEGVKVSLDSTGKLVDPIYRYIQANEYYWDALFPRGSLYILNPATSNPRWIRLNGSLELRGHRFPTGTEITFNDHGRLKQVQAPNDGRPLIALYNYAISIPEEATLLFSDWAEEPLSMNFKTAVSLAGMSFLPQLPFQWAAGFITFHGNGRIASGVLAEDAAVDEPHYGKILAKGQNRISFNENREVQQATLAEDYTFVYRILDPSEVPNASCLQDLASCMRQVTLPANTEFQLSYQGKLERAELRTTWQQEGLTARAGSILLFNGDHSLARVHFSPMGGKIGSFAVGEGPVDFHPNGQAQSLILAEEAQVGELRLTAGTLLSFYASGRIRAISSRVDKPMVFDLGGFRFIDAVDFYESGRIKSGYLHADFVYNGVSLASRDRCYHLRLVNPQSGTNSCAIVLYEDGHSIMRAVAAFDLEIGGIFIKAGQTVEFDEDGHVFAGLGL